MKICNTTIKVSVPPPPSNYDEPLPINHRTTSKSNGWYSTSSCFLVNMRIREREREALSRLAEMNYNFSLMETPEDNLSDQKNKLPYVCIALQENLIKEMKFQSGEGLPGNREKDSTSPTITSLAIVVQSQCSFDHILSLNENKLMLHYFLQQYFRHKIIVNQE